MKEFGNYKILIFQAILPIKHSSESELNMIFFVSTNVLLLKNMDKRFFVWKKMQTEQEKISNRSVSQEGP